MYRVVTRDTSYPYDLCPVSPTPISLPRCYSVDPFIPHNHLIESHIFIFANSSTVSFTFPFNEATYSRHSSFVANSRRDILPFLNVM